MNNNNTLTSAQQLDQLPTSCLQMYGVPFIGEWYDERVEDAKSHVMSMLSDAQELMVRGYNEEARQTLNRAKWIVSNKL